MKKCYSLFVILLFVLPVRSRAQNIVAGRMNEVFLKTDLSGNAVLTTPWEVTYGPDGFLWITDAKTYKVYRMDPVTGVKTQILDLSNTSSFTPAAFRRTFASSQNPWPQGGLAGLAIHPDFMNATTPKKYVYISYVRSYDSTSVTASGGYFFTNRVVRFTYNTVSGQLESPVSLCDTLPGSNDHNSQRLIIVPVSGVSYLFCASGDMGAGQLASRWRTNNAQNISSYQGKILRFNLEPDTDAGILDQWIPNDNPYSGAAQSAVWCMGIRNNQGLAYDSVRNILYGSSHGPYSDDEVNIIEPGRNYGHPLVIGYAADENYAGSSAGYYPTSTLPVITSEMSNATAIGASYKDPLLAGYPTTQANINNIWSTNPSNGGWPSEAWSGLGLYNNSTIPGWKNSLLMAGLKWGRMIRTKLDNNGTAIVASGTKDTVCYFDGLPRYRDMAFSPDGRDIYITTDNSNSTVAPQSPSVNNPALVSCLGCVQKFTFLGYNDVSGTSSISAIVPIAKGKTNVCEDANTININSLNTNLWVPITDTSSNVVAEIKANGNILGNVSTSLFSNGNAVREQAANKTLYLDRNITITPQTQPSSAVSIRLYLSNTEFDALKNAVNSVGQPSGVNTISNLAIFKNTDACQPVILNAAAAVSTTNQASFGGGGYVVQADVSSLSSFYMASVTSLLPVHALSFNGSVVNSIGQLRWVTEDEKETQSFTVERSINSRDFYPIGSLTASKSGGEALYAFPDSTMSQLPAKVVYYRLKLMGVAGTSSYSPVIILNLGPLKPAVSIHPNPVINDFTMTVSAMVTEKATWQLTDITGKTVMQHVISLSAGNNDININTAVLPAGTYYLKLTGNNINQGVKLQKL